MRKNDKQLGAPNILYTGTTAQIEAIVAPQTGAIAYSTDDEKIGVYTGTEWTWGGGGGGGGPHASTHARGGNDILNLADLGDTPAPDGLNNAQFIPRVSNDGATIEWVDSQGYQSAYPPIDGQAVHLDRLDFQNVQYDGTPWYGQLVLLEDSEGSEFDKYYCTIDDLCNAWLNWNQIIFVPDSLTVTYGTLVAGTAADLAATGGTDVHVDEAASSNALQLTITLVNNMNPDPEPTHLMIYGKYDGGS
jgi:hypothetical protein